ncbi:hypothetical protein [Enterococcus phage EFap02]|nr:hypothetical protein [Enterococcus phage EFap02]
MTVGSTNVEACDKQTPLETAKQSARVLYGVKNNYEEGKPKVEQRFMGQFKKTKPITHGYQR